MATNPYILGSSSVPAGPWVPTDIGGCTPWLRSDLGITMDGSNRVAIWADQSGEGNDVAQDTDSKKLVWTPNQLNGYPALVGDTVDDYLIKANMYWSTQEITVFAVLYYPGPSAYGNFLDYGYSSPGDLGFRQWAATEGKVQFANASANRGATTAGSHAGAYHYYVATLSVADHFTMRVDGVNDGTDDYTTTISAGPRELRINARQDGYPGGGSYVEFALFNSVVIGSDLTALETYAANRYGL